MKLTERQKRFVDYYLELGNATEAAKEAGYSKKTARSIGSENLTKPDIQNYMKQRLQEIESARIAQPAEIMEYLSNVLRGKSRAEVVVIVGTGEGCTSADHVQKAPDEKERLKAAELLGKRYRMFSDNMNIDGGIQVCFSGEDDLKD
jgi:phage terminase small subunit